MLIGGDKRQVVENIRIATERGEYNCKVEVDDPSLSYEQRDRILKRFTDNDQTIGYRFCNVLARALTDTSTRILNKDTKIVGLENLSGIRGGVIVTSNHFDPLDNTVVRRAMNKVGYKRLFIVSQDTNLAMKGWIGFLMNHEDIIPLANNITYLRKHFEPMLRDVLRQGHAVLIYPEQEMWFRYRKPRPPKRGAYHYAAKNHVPIISCFVEILETNKKDNDQFYQNQYVMHILPPIYPDPMKSDRENSEEMMAKDYQQKVAAYEEAYGKKLTYDFDETDIAGWIPQVM